MSEKPNRITQTQGEDYDYKNNDGYWPDLQNVHPDVAVRYLDRHVATLEKEGKLPPPSNRLPVNKKVVVVKKTRARWVKRLFPHEPAAPVVERKLTPSEEADRKIASALHYEELIALKDRWINKKKG
jgi:hypothetical protein